MAGAKGSEAVFDAWMLRESDAVQACARAYGEREVLGACLRQLQQVLPLRPLGASVLPARQQARTSVCCVSTCRAGLIMSGANNAAFCLEPC